MARKVAHTLAVRANNVMASGVTGSDVLRRWTEGKPAPAVTWGILGDHAAEVTTLRAVQ